MTEKEIRDAIAGHELRNKELSALLKQKGVDLSEPRRVELHFWAWSERDATELAASLKEWRFEILVCRPAVVPDSPSRWNIEAAVEQSVELTVRPKFTEELVRIAALHRGRYDGWGTSI